MVILYRIIIIIVNAGNFKSIEKPDGIGRFIEHNTENEKL